MIVQTYEQPGAIIRIHDDCCSEPTERQKQKISNLILAPYYRELADLKNEEEIFKEYEEDLVGGNSQETVS